MITKTTCGTPEDILKDCSLTKTRLMKLPLRSGHTLVKTNQPINLPSIKHQIIKLMDNFHKICVHNH